jgi:hypothetical protein
LENDVPAIAADKAARGYVHVPDGIETSWFASPIVHKPIANDWVSTKTEPVLGSLNLPH